MKHVELHEWATYRANPDPFCAPELQGLTLVGTVKGHPRKPDGHRVRTSSVQTAEGRVVTTQSGTVYLLKEPHPDYRTWLAEHRPDWDPENPIKMLGGPSK